MRIRGARAFAGGVATLLLCLGASGSRRVQGLEDLRAVFQRRVPGPTPSSSELVARLAALGAPAVPDLYRLSSGKALDELIGGEWVPDEWLCRPEEIPVLSATALESAPTAAVCAELERALRAEPSFQERVVMLRILGAQRSADGLALVLQDAQELGSLGLSSASVRCALREALVAILAHDARAFERAEQALDELQPESCLVLAEAAGDAGRTQGMEFLERMLHRSSIEPAPALEAMARLEQSRPWDLGGRTMVALEPWLRSPVASERALAARLVCELRALDFVPAVIELASDGEPLVRSSALAALERFVGHALDHDPEQLEAWFEREESWREAHLSEVLAAAERQAPGRAMEALRELARHPLYRHEVAGTLAAELLRARESDLILCAELERIGSRRAVPGLLEAMEQGGPRLRAAAWRALRSITGEDRKLSPVLWRELVDS